jgi:hypothetical protein
MGLRVRKSFKVAPGVRFNVGSKSASVSVGVKGAHKTFSTTGRKTTSVHIAPGISSVTTESSGSRGRSASSSSNGSSYTAPAKPKGIPVKLQKVLLIIFGVIFALSVLTCFILISKNPVVYIISAVVYGLLAYWCFKKYKALKSDPQK